ncbi:MAG: WD40/YVTN/BNR-like repeat-containing protein [Bacillota bacterium]
MRKTSGGVLAALLLVALFSVASAGGCSLGRRAARVPLPGPIYIHMVDASIGWVVAGGLGSGTGTAIVARTTDGGATWADVGPKGLSDRDVALQAYTFKDAQTAWLATSRDGQPPDIWRTTDGGKTWRDTTTSIEHGLIKQLFFLDPQTGWMLVGTNAATQAELVDLYRTGDGGATWTKTAGVEPGKLTPGGLPMSGYKTGLTFLNESTGWLAGFLGAPASVAELFYVTHDGGRTWQPQTLAIEDGFGSAGVTIAPPVFFGQKEGLLLVSSGSASRLYATGDRGATWTPEGDVSASGTPVIDVVDRDHVFLAYGHSIVATSDGGHHWTAVYDAKSDGRISSLSFADPRVGWAVMSNGPYDSFYLAKTIDGGAHWELVHAMLQQSR